MKPVRFAYYRPDTIDEALDRLREHGGQARPLAGGQSLLALMNSRAVRPEALVDLGRLAELRRLGVAPDGLRVGAMVTHAELESASWPGFGVMAESARLIGTSPIRTRGTVGGSITHADPRSEWCLLAVLLGAQITLRGPAGDRTVPADAFFTGSGQAGACQNQTAAGWDELVTQIRFPRPLPGTAVAEFGPQAGQFPLVAAGVSALLRPDGAIADATIALAGLAGRPVRARGTELALVGCRPDRSLRGVVSGALAGELDPPADKDASAADRMELAAVVTERALRAAIARHRAWHGHRAWQRKGDQS